ncbi:hypothetical protein [Sphingobium xenophagum]|uniref:hypothetical protein n=1 Tax=Sphingobium xenophagum TaxID=121428 RepID=UPI0003759514|nr:hypothetical protein [Sphingobium xenophagum]
MTVDKSKLLTLGGGLVSTDDLLLETNEEIGKRAIWFATRASLLAGAALLPSGVVAHDGMVSYVKDGGSSIDDLPDWSALGGIIDAMHHYQPTDSGIQQAINRAIAAASALGGGAVMLVNKGAVYAATGSIVPKTGAHLFGFGRPTIRLANGVNKSLIESENFLALSGTNSGLGVSNVSIRDMILDANRANNTGAGANEGHCVALFGRDFLLQDLLLKDARRRGLHTEYGTGAVGVSPFNARLRGVTINTAGEDGWYNKVSDLHLDSVNIRSAGQNTDNSFDAIYLGASGGVRGVNLNVWRGGGGASTTHRYSLNIEGGASTIHGLNLETAKTANLRLGSNRNSITGLVSYNMLIGALYHAIVDGNSNTLDMIVQAGGVTGEATTAFGVKLGDVIAVSSNEVHVAMTGHSGGLLDFANSGGLNKVTGEIYRPTGGAFYTGTVRSTDRVDITADGASPTEQASYSKKAGSGGSITPVGTTQAGAALLRHTVNRVYTTSSSNDATLLPKAAAGLELTVGNIGTVTISVFPTGADNHQGLAASAAYTIPAGASRIFKALSSTEWGAV